MSLSANWLLVTMFALMLSFRDEGVRAIQCRRELVLVEEVDVRFETRALVVLVLNKIDFLEVGGHGVWKSELVSLSDSFEMTYGIRLRRAEG